MMLNRIILYGNESNMPGSVYRLPHREKLCAGWKETHLNGPGCLFKL